MQTHQQHAAAQAAFAVQQEGERARLVRLCNIAASQLGWKASDLWETIKQEHGGAASLTEMDVPDLERILTFARSKGWKPKHTRTDGKMSRALDQAAQARMLRGLWLEMHGLGIVRQPDESALCQWVSNSRSANVTTDLALLSGQQLDEAINRLRKFREREIMAGEMYCPTCGKAFRPTPKQARALGKLLCDGHVPAVLYLWRTDRLGGRQPKTHVRMERRGGRRG